MASAKIIQSKDKNKDGTISISIQIIHNRKAYPKLLCRIPPEHWASKRVEVRSRNEFSVKYNQIIHLAIHDAKDYLLDCQILKISPGPHAFLHGGKKGALITNFITAKIARLKSFRTINKYNTCITRIQEAGLDIPMVTIDKAWVKAFDDHLRKAGNNDNTRSTYMSKIKSVVTDAMNDGVIKSNPFAGWHKTSTPGRKAKLSRGEINTLIDARFTGAEEDARKVFVFAFMTRGMRAFDVITLQWSDINDGRLTYVADKSPEGKEGKRFDILITDEMNEVLKTLGRSGPYVFPFAKMDKAVMLKDEKRYKEHIDSLLTTVNKHLKTIAAECKIKKTISMHVARHTFAFLCDQAGLPLGDIQSLLGHGDMRTTMIYVQSLRETDEMDRAAGRVIS